MRFNVVVKVIFWTPENAVLSQWGAFDSAKRMRFISLMGMPGLKTYLYDPKLLREGPNATVGSGNPSYIATMNMKLRLGLQVRLT